MNYFILFITVISLASCHETKKTPLFNERVGEIQYLIDQKKYSQGLSEIESLLRENPKNERLLALKASLYLHRAGIGIKDLLSLETTLSRPVKVEQQLIPLFWYKGQKANAPLTDIIRKLNQFVAELTEFNYRIGNIQLLTHEQYRDSQLSLDALNQILYPSAGVSLYRGLIRILNFKYLWTQGQLLNISLEELCSSSIKNLRSTAKTTITLVQEILQDMTIGAPRSGVELQKISNQIQIEFKNLDVFLEHYETQAQNVSDMIQILWEIQNPETKEQISCSI